MPTTEGRRRRRPGFRTRVLGFSSALLLLSTVVGLLAQRAVLHQRLERRVDASLEQERQELERLAQGQDPATGRPFGADVAAIFTTFLARNVPASGEVFATFVDGRPFRTTPAPLRLDQLPGVSSRWATLRDGERGRIDTDAGEVRYLASPLVIDGRTAGVFVVANFVRGEQQEIEAAVRVEAAVALAVLAATTVLAWVVAGRLLRPVRDLTATARTISQDDLSRRIAPEGHDELAELGRTFDAMLDRLESAFATQRAFVDDAGHELRTPITIIRGHLEVMGDDPVERAATLALVTDELDRMGRIVEDLLLLATADQPDFVHRGPVELNDLTTELFAKARTWGPERWRLERSAEGVVALVAQRVTQAVLNLARNAAEHTPPGTPVSMGSDLHDGVLRLWVRDSGPGIDPAEQSRIFERFSRGRGGRRSGGAGLGLSIVAAVAAAHGGRVELDSSPGHGATFTLVLPAPPPPPPPPDSEGALPWPGS